MRILVTSTIISLFFHSIIFFSFGPDEITVYTQELKIKINPTDSLQNRSQLKTQKNSNLQASKNYAQSLKTQDKKETTSNHSEITNNISKKILDKYLKSVLTTIHNNKTYPKKAIKLKLEDKLEVSFSIIQNGEIEDFAISRNSKYSLFNKEVELIFQRIGKFKPLPNTIGQKRIALKIPIEFSL